MILDKDGKPIPPSQHESDPGISGGWIQSSGLAQGLGPDASLRYSVSRQTARRRARLLFFTNHLIEGALNVVHSFLVGENFTWGEVYDRALLEVTEDWAALNDLTALVDRFHTEFMLDGESAALLPQPSQDPGRDRPSRLALADVDLGVELDFDTARGVYGIRVSGLEGTFEPDRFVWTAHQSMYNDPRGFPVIMRALDPAASYVNLLNHRLRLHDIQSRLNAVYTALVDFGSGHDSALKQHQAKAAIFGVLPRDGGVLTLAKDKASGQAEDMRFLEPRTGASDASDDARLFRLAVAVSFGIPEHWLGEGGGVTRTTAEAMGEPAKRLLARRQAVLRGWLDSVMRREARRRLGENYRPWVQRAEVRDNGLTRVMRRTRVPLERYYWPWQFPSVEVQSLEAQVRQAEFLLDRQIASRQTIAGRMGIDYALERELMQADQGNNPTTPPPPPSPNDPQGGSR